MLRILADLAQWGVSVLIYNVLIPVIITLVLGVGYLVFKRFRRPAGR